MRPEPQTSTYRFPFFYTETASMGSRYSIWCCCRCVARRSATSSTTHQIPEVKQPRNLYRCCLNKISDEDCDTIVAADASQTRISAVMGPNYLRLADDELNYCNDPTCGYIRGVLCRQKFQLDAVIINVTGIRDDDVWERRYRSGSPERRS
jgi:hypothetical protein